MKIAAVHKSCKIFSASEEEKRKSKEKKTERNSSNTMVILTRFVHLVFNTFLYS